MVVDTFIGRISGKQGAIEYKTIGTFGDPVHPTFLNWDIRGVERSISAAGDSGYTVRTFRFSARFPLGIEPQTPQPGQPIPARYEQIGVGLDRMYLRDGVPTLVGTLSLPNTTGKAFLVLTIASTGAGH